MSSWQRGDNRSLENGDRAVNSHTNSLSVLMRKSAVPKRMVGAGEACNPDSWLYIKTDKHTQEGDTCRHTRGIEAQAWELGHTHTHTHSLGAIYSLLGSRANFKGVSIFRPEQLDPSEMDQAHQSPRLCLVPWIQWLGWLLWWAWFSQSVKLK